MNDERPTPAEEALALLAKVFPSSGELNVAAYRALGGAEGIARLMQQAATPPDLPPPSPADDESEPEPFDFAESGWETRYLAVRAQLFDADQKRPGKK